MGMVICLESYRHKGFPLYVDVNKQKVYGSKDIHDDGEPIEFKIARLKASLEKINKMLIDERERTKQNEEFPFNP